MSIISGENQRKFVFKLKPKYEEPKQIMTYDILKYIATFIDASDTYTLISYVMAIPFAMYEIRKKFIEYFKIEKQLFDIIPSCLYKFMNEPIRILNASLIPIFSIYGLLNYIIQDHKKVLTRENGRRFTIHLIKEQNKVSSREIYSILNEFTCKPKTMHPTFYTLDILYNTDIALLSRYISFPQIDNYIYKKLKSYYTITDIKYLNTTEKALLMFHYDVDDNFNSKFIGRDRLRHKLIVESLKENHFKIIDILFENRLIYIYNPTHEYTEVDLYIGNIKIGSDEFNKSRNIIKYYLDRLIEFYNYEGAICNMLNYSFSINNIEMCKYLLSLNGARKGISILLGSRIGIESRLCNIRDSSKDELDKYKQFTIDVFQQNNFILYDFLMNNLPNDIGIDFNVVTKSTLSITIDYEIYNKYIFIIVKYITYITENENSADATNLDNPNNKYYCSRKTLINMYNILLLPKYFVELQNKLKIEFDELMEKEESSQPSNQMLREYIKTLYCKIRVRKNQTINISNLMTNAINTNRYGLENHRCLDLLVEYLITIPEYLLDNENFKNKVIEKINEFINSNTDESYIETAHMMQTFRKYNEILQSMFGS